jgi:hypothetical protein
MEVFRTNMACGKLADTRYSFSDNPSALIPFDGY